MDTIIVECSKNINLVTGVMDPLAEYLLCKQKELHLDSQHQLNNQVQ